MQPDNTNTNPDYSFLSGGEPKKGAPSKKQRILIAGGGGALLLIAIIIVFSLLSGGGGNAATSLKLARMHTELIRVSEIGEDKARGQEAKNLATTTRLTLSSSEASILAIAKQDQEITTRLLRAGADSGTDQTLTEAEQRSQFDEIFVPLLVEEIKEYQAELQAAYEASSSTKNKTTYSNLYDNLEKISSAAELNQ